MSKIFLTEEDLQSATCGNPNCPCGGKEKIIFITPQCHVGAPTTVSYDKDHPGYVTVSCAICRDIVACIEISSGSL